MTSPRFYKPARGIHRSLTCIAVAMIVSIVGAPLAGVVGAELIGWAFVAICCFLLIVLTKIGMHVRCHVKRDSIPAGHKNQETLKEFIKAYPDMRHIKEKTVKNARELKWGDCVRFRKEVNNVLLKRKTDSLLAGLERLGII